MSEGMTGAALYERSGERATYRQVSATGDRASQDPKLWWQLFPSFLELRHTVEKALVSVIQEA